MDDADKGLEAGFKPGEPLSLEMNGFRSNDILSFTQIIGQALFKYLYNLHLIKQMIFIIFYFFNNYFNYFVF
jgi:hypothetical protein